MNFDRRHRPSNKRENDNKWTDRSDNRARDNFGNRRRDQNIESDFRVRENFFDNSDRSRDQTFGNDFRKREYFNEFTDQGREKKFGSDFRMRDNSNDYINQSHDRKFESDYQKRERFNQFSEQGRGTNFGSDFRVRDNYNDNGNRSDGRKFGNDYQERERFNQFSAQEENFGNDKRMESTRSQGNDNIMNEGIRAIYDDYSNLGRNNNLGNNNRMRDSSRDFFNTGRDSTFRSDDRIHDFSSHGRVNDFGSDNDMRKSFNDFHNQGHNTNLGTNNRTRESLNFGNQRRGNNFPNDDRMPESFNEFGYGNRDNIRQSTFDGQDRYFNRDLNQTRDNDEMFRKRSNENYLPQTPKISRQNTSINYSKLQGHSIRKMKKRQTLRQAFLTYMEEQSIIRAQKETDKNKSEIKREKKESDVVRTRSKNIETKIENLRNGLNDIIAAKLSDKSEMPKSVRRKLNKQAWHAKTKQSRKLKSAIIRQHRKVYFEKKLEMDNKEEAHKDEVKPKSLCLIIKDCGHRRRQISKPRQTLFEKALRNKIKNVKPDAPKPIFTFAAFIDGIYRVTCADEFTYGWVRSNVPSLQLWRKSNLKVIRDMLKGILYIPASPKPSIDFEPISEKDLNADLFNRNSIRRGKIPMTNQLKIKHAISALIPRGSHVPYIYTTTARGTLSIKCKDLTSLQWLYDHLSVLDGLWLDADLRLIQRRTLLCFRKITFTLKQIVTSPIAVLKIITRNNDTLHTGLWRPLQYHPDGRTFSYAIEDESVKDLEALGSSIKYLGGTIDVQIHPRQESQAKINIDSPSLIQEIDNFELKEKETVIADLSDAEGNASPTTDDD